jgi:hypothetical protein
MTAKQLLFLDIDGVLTSRSHFNQVAEQNTPEPTDVFDYDRAQIDPKACYWAG